MPANVFSDSYERESTGVTPEGLACAVVLRQCEGRSTRFFLTERPTKKGPRWFSVGPQQVSNGQVRFFPEKKGVRLTDSKMDRALLGAAIA